MPARVMPFLIATALLAPVTASAQGPTVRILRDVGTAPPAFLDRKTVAARLAAGGQVRLSDALRKANGPQPFELTARTPYLDKDRYLQTDGSLGPDWITLATDSDTVPPSAYSHPEVYEVPSEEKRTSYSQEAVLFRLPKRPYAIDVDCVFKTTTAKPPNLHYEIDKGSSGDIKIADDGHFVSRIPAGSTMLSFRPVGNLKVSGPSVALFGCRFEPDQP